MVKKNFQIVDNTNAYEEMRSMMSDRLMNTGI